MMILFMGMDFNAHIKVVIVSHQAQMKQAYINCGAQGHSSRGAAFLLEVPSPKTAAPPKAF